MMMMMQVPLRIVSFFTLGKFHTHVGDEYPGGGRRG